MIEYSWMYVCEHFAVRFVVRFVARVVGRFAAAAWSTTESAEELANALKVMAITDIPIIIVYQCYCCSVSPQLVSGGISFSEKWKIVKEVVTHFATYKLLKRKRLMKHAKCP